MASLAPLGSGIHSANDNITRFELPSRNVTPVPHNLFHSKTRCFV
jgi:ATP citrate (pro-S)-lyase